MKLYLKYQGAPTLQREGRQLIVDNFGEGLPPDLVRQRVREFLRLEDRITDSMPDMEIILVTSNPTALSEFVRESDWINVYAWSDGEWVEILDHWNSDYLEHFVPGDLYENMLFEKRG
jgi:hypothetical protein